ncbi:MULTISPECIES: carboxypeptidase-like regulatory domain-containing protein [Acidobacteriaceae]|uniref:carboxypeptidase-like regulatory domain-containing protein n=1 Tax=Acidobacteriaceae TaxID=204434 RepID=UPI0020B16217|nr:MULTISPECIES: carboxypeptidase-like regulatory domain-containing protein [Acidobacteriaceae]MDW5265135.1 carboxypeptidase-like regulatory domain-containing protein [Edaphobacter sp.]
MNTRWLWITVLVVVPIASLAAAQQTCSNGVRVEGNVTDPTGAVISGALVQASGGEKATTDDSGHYLLPCVSPASAAISVRAEGFSASTAYVWKT